MNKKESTRLPPFKFLYGRELVLRLNILLKLWERYLGTETCVLLLKEEYKVFLQVHRRLKKIRRKMRDRRTGVGQAVPNVKIRDMYI